jgi:putative aminopeptidase FrvX
MVVDHLRAGGLKPIVDRLGQVAVTFGGDRDGAPTVLVTAHLDELGLTVRGIDADGMLRVHRLGGMPERVLPGTRLLVHTRHGDVPAVVGIKSHHLTPPEDKYVAKPATELYLDIGAATVTQAESAGVRVGDPVTYQPQWDEFVGGRFSGKSLDDRLGVAALLGYVDWLVVNAPQQRVVVAFTTQEEFHVRGTLALVSKFSPDIVVNVDIAPATDTPDLAGQGAGKESVAIQHDAMIGVITDAAFVTMASADGIAAVGIGIPVRYTHSPVETAQASDVMACVQLLIGVVPRLADVDLARGASQIVRGGLA